jgi:ABC-type phosphate transport system substrate-binding protein
MSLSKHNWKYAMPLALALALAVGMVDVARADVVLVVSAKSPVGELSHNQAADIFLGKTSRFPNGDLAVPIDQAEGARTRDEFYLMLVGKSPAQVKAHWSKLIFTGRGQPPKEIIDSKAIKRTIANSTRFIGYIDRSAVDSSVKVVMTLP